MIGGYGPGTPRMCTSFGKNATSRPPKSTQMVANPKSHAATRRNPLAARDTVPLPFTTFFLEGCSLFNAVRPKLVSSPLDGPDQGVSPHPQALAQPIDRRS